MWADAWIKLRTKLPRDGRLRVASRVCHALGVTEYRTSVTLMLGAIATLWCLADEHADADGVLTGYTADAIDAEVGVPGFCAALPPEWINLDGQWVQLPEYQEHNGTTGKSRAQATKRKRKERAVTPVADASRSQRDTTVTREEKSREEKSSPVGDSSTSARVEEGARALDDLGLDERAAADVMGRCIEAATALRRMGMRDAHMANAALAEIVARGATTEQLVLVAAELALKKAGFLHDPDLHPDLVILVANARSAQEMGLSPAKYAELRKAMPNVGYVCSTLAGRAADGATKLGDAHGNGNGTRGAAATAAGGRAHRDSAAGRAEAARRAGDAREEDHDPGY